MPLHPPTEPSDAGLLDVGDGQLVHWELSGNPAGQPAVVLHGGPGSGSTPGQRRLLDPGAYRVVLLDQRGSGRSMPSVADPSTSLATNTTAHLVADLELLRAHLGIDRWLLLGMSWGSTLGLAYAEAHPDRVSALVLGPVTMTRRADVDWLARGAGRFFPEAFERFRAGVPEAERDGDLVAAYARQLAEPDPAVRARAADGWCAWEDALVSVETGGAGQLRFTDPAFRYAFARTVTHYFAHAAWLEEDQLLRDAHRLAGIPGVLVHGRLDLGGPLQVAFELARAWPDADLVVLERSGHTSDDLGEALVAATDRFRAQL